VIEKIEKRLFSVSSQHLKIKGSTMRLGKNLKYFMSTVKQIFTEHFAVTVEIFKKTVVGGESQ
jgi:hypothetical protein